MNQLQHPPSQIIRAVLIDLALASDGGTWPVYHGREPAAPDNCVTVYTTQGSTISRTMIDGRIVEKRGIQVRIRARDEATGWLKADEIRTTLAQSLYRKVVHVESSSYYVHSADRIGEIMSLGTEAPTTGRNLFTLNFVASIREA